MLSDHVQRKSCSRLLHSKVGQKAWHYCLVLVASHCFPNVYARTLHVFVVSMQWVRKKGDDSTPFQTVSPWRHSWCCTQNVNTLPLCHTPFSHLANACAKWAWLSECLFRKVTEIDRQSRPLFPTSKERFQALVNNLISTLFESYWTHDTVRLLTQSAFGCMDHCLGLTTKDITTILFWWSTSICASMCH